MQNNLLDTNSDPGMKNGEGEEKGVKRIVNGRRKDTRIAISVHCLHVIVTLLASKADRQPHIFRFQALYTSSKGMDGCLHTALHWRLGPRISTFSTTLGARYVRGYRFKFWALGTYRREMIWSHVLHLTNASCWFALTFLTG